MVGRVLRLFMYFEAPGTAAAREAAEEWSKENQADGFWLFETDDKNRIIKQVLPR